MAAQAALTEREPVKPSELRAPVPFLPAADSQSSGALEHHSTPAPQESGAPVLHKNLMEHHKPRGPKVDESQFDSRKNPELRGRVPPDKHLAYWRLQQVLRRDMRLLLEEAMDDLLLKYGFGIAGNGESVEHWCSTIKKRDQEEDQKKNDLRNIYKSNHSSSDLLFPESGAPMLQTPDELKEKAALACYAKYTKNRIQARDHKAYREGFTPNADSKLDFQPGVARVPLHIIELGIRETVIDFRGHRIRSFVFCLLKIHEFAELAEQGKMDAYAVATYSERTFDLRMECKRNPDLYRSDDEYQARLRRAAAGDQQILPSIHSEMVAGLPNVTEMPPVRKEVSEEVAEQSIVTDEDAALWQRVLGLIKSKLSAESFNTWFQALTFEGLDHTRRVIRLLAPNSVIKNQVNTNYSSLVDEALMEGGLDGYLVGWSVEQRVRNG